MSVKVMARVWAHSQQKGGELLVMLALADFANDDSECWPSIPTLAQKSRLSERQTRRVLNVLVTAGELRRRPSNGGRNRRNHYFITVTENPDKITLTELPCKNNPDTGDRETLSPMSGALNRHRNVNKSGAEAPEFVFKQPNAKKQKADTALLAAFDEFYRAYPRHVAKSAALKSWQRLKPTAELAAAITAGASRYAKETIGTEPRYIAHPATWLSNRRWEDEPTTTGAGRSLAAD